MQTFSKGPTYAILWSYIHMLNVRSCSHNAGSIVNPLCVRVCERVGNNALSNTNERNNRPIYACKQLKPAHMYICKYIKIYHLSHLSISFFLSSLSLYIYIYIYISISHSSLSPDLYDHLVFLLHTLTIKLLITISTEGFSVKYPL